MPRFNREKLAILLLREGRAVLLLDSLDTAGVCGAGRRIGEALEHPSDMRWDSKPPNSALWEWENELVHIRSEAIARHRESCKSK
jgi:hypothetical protein